MKFQGDILNFCDFIQVFVFTTNHHLNDVALKLIQCFNADVRPGLSSFYSPTL